MKQYVINLPRAENRRRSIARQFQGLELDFEFLPGTDWQQLSAEDWLQVDRARPGAGRAASTLTRHGCLPSQSPKGPGGSSDG